MELGLPPVPDNDNMLPKLRKHFLDLVINATGTKEKVYRFPGTMPLTLSRRHLKMVADNDYVALEKSDGTRYMLLALTGFVVLIDRQMRFYIIHPNPCILGRGFVEAQDNTCLDGELTYNQVTLQYEYLIYDAIAIDGDLTIAKQSFRARMQAAEIYVAGPRVFATFSAGLLRLRIKDYYEKGSMRKLFSRIRRNAKGHYIYMNNDRRDGVICNENDGVIFSPVGMPYQVRNCPALLKWKPPHLNSIDFQLQLERTLDTKRNNRPSVRCFIAYKGERSNVRLREVYFPSKQRQHFLAGFDKYNGAIAEFAYDRNAGEWKFMRRRDDKENPNFSTTVIDTMETIAEHMEKEELVRHIEGQSKRAPASELDLIKVVSQNEVDCTFRDDYFSEDNHDYLISTPISLTPRPFLEPQPGRQSGRGRRQPDGHGQQERATNGEAHHVSDQDPAPSSGGRDAFQYSEDV